MKAPTVPKTALAVAMSAMILAAPAFAQGRPPFPDAQGQDQNQYRKKKHHNSGVAAGIAAGVLGGVAGAALLGGQGEPQSGPGYYPPPPPPPPPGPRYVEGDDEEECRIVRKPVYDEDGEVVSYRTRRVCR